MACGQTLPCISKQELPAPVCASAPTAKWTTRVPRCDFALGFGLDSLIAAANIVAFQPASLTAENVTGYSVQAFDDHFEASFYKLGPSHVGPLNATVKVCGAYYAGDETIISWGETTPTALGFRRAISPEVKLVATLVAAGKECFGATTRVADQVSATACAVACEETSTFFVFGQPSGSCDADAQQCQCWCETVGDACAQVDHEYYDLYRIDVYEVRFTDLSCAPTRTSDSISVLDPAGTIKECQESCADLVDCKFFQFGLYTGTTSRNRCELRKVCKNTDGDPFGHGGDTNVYYVNHIIQPSRTCGFYQISEIGEVGCSNAVDADNLIAETVSFQQCLRAADTGKDCGVDLMFDAETGECRCVLPGSTCVFGSGAFTVYRYSCGEAALAYLRDQGDLPTFEPEEDSPQGRFMFDSRLDGKQAAASSLDYDVGPGMEWKGAFQKTFTLGKGQIRFDIAGTAGTVSLSVSFRFRVPAMVRGRVSPFQCAARDAYARDGRRLPHPPPLTTVPWQSCNCRPTMMALYAFTGRSFGDPLSVQGSARSWHQ